MPARRCARGASWLALAACAFVRCTAGKPSGPVTVRLVDLYKPERVMGRVAPGAPPPRTEWRFAPPLPSAAPDKNPASLGWEAFNDVSGLAVREGRLVGRATGDLPLLHFERTSGLDDKDVVHEIEVRLRVSSGANLSVSLVGAPKLDRDDAMDYSRHFPWDFTTPIVAGSEIRTYTLRTPFSKPASQLRHVFLRPSHRAGATFEGPPACAAEGEPLRGRVGLPLGAARGWGGGQSLRPLSSPAPRMKLGHHELGGPMIPSLASP